MSKVVSEKKSNSFVKGLITEASALTFPENASLDEDNFDLLLNGSRVRRLGIDYESGYVLTDTGIPAGILSGTRKSSHRWDFPGGSTTESIGVVRAYNKLWFINLLSPSPSSSLLNGGNPITITDLANSEIETTTINGFFVIVSSDLSWPVVLTYNSSTDTVTQTTYPLQVRDFWGIEDGLELNERPSTLSEEHDYNLRNQGWSSQIEATGTVVLFATTWAASTSYSLGNLVIPSISPYTTYECIVTHTSSSSFSTDLINGKWRVYTPPSSGITPTRVFKLISGIWSYITQQTFSSIFSILRTKSELTVYPSNTDVWTLGKIASSSSADFEKYDPLTLKRNSIDNTEAPKGSFIIDAFKRGYSRVLLTGLTTLPTDEETGKVTTVTSFSGRVCYSGIDSLVINSDIKSPSLAGSIFFSQLIKNKSSLGKCYQEADPTSSTFSDIVDTDGGMIIFPEISKIVKLVSIKDSLLVFADNGVWEIYGDTGGFKATSYQTAKISNIGVNNAKTIVTTGSTIIYWNKAGISVVSPNPQTGRYEEQNISLTTIQSLYNNDISDLAKKHARGFYDELANRIYWLYNDTVDYTDEGNVNHYNRQLCLDLTLKAFFTYSISPLTNNSPYVVSIISLPPNAITTSVEDVYVENTKVNVGANQVQVPQDISVSRLSKYSFLTFVGTSFTLSQYNNDSFLDWKLADGIGIDYSSYLVTGYDTFGDTMRTKQIPYIFFQFNRTETGFETVGGNLVAKNPSGCLVQAQWNWSNSATGGKWGTAFQTYRYSRNYTPSGVSDTYDTGDAVIETKNKLRGSGKALSLKIQSETGKDMQLLGWSYIITGDGTP